MKLNSFKFQDGKVLWLPGFPVKEPKKHEDLWEQYEEAVAQSLASAIEVAPEDMEEVKCLIYDSIHPPTLVVIGVKADIRTTFIGENVWQPENGKVYSAECEMETHWECFKFGRNLDRRCKWCIDCKECSQVARLKPMKDENSAHSFTEGMEVDAVLKHEGEEEKELELREFIKNRFRQIEVILSGPGSAEWYPFDGFDREGVIAMKRAYQDIFRQLTPSSLNNKI